MKLDIIILSILEKGNQTGYSLMKSIQQSTGWKPSAGSMYPTLKSLLTKNYVTVAKKDNKKIYSIAEQGKHFIEEFKKEKEKCLIETEKHMKIFGYLFDSKEMKLATELMTQFAKKDNVFGDITKDLINFKIEFLKKVLYAKDKERLKRFIKKSIIELKKIE